MIKVFLFRRCRITNADRIPEIIAEYLFYFLWILIRKCLTELVQCLPVFSGYITEPFPDLSDKQLSDFQIWNHQSVLIILQHIRAGSDLC